MVMKIPTSVVNLTCGIFTPLAMAFLQDSLSTMLPWLMVMAMVVVCDLAFGVRKSLKLGVHVSISLAIRETMGKLLVYTSFVILVCMIEVATKHTLQVAMWSCLLICAIEGCSIIGNLLKPYGIEMSLRNVIKAFANRALGVDETTADIMLGKDEGVVPEDVVERVRKQERARWEQRKAHTYGSEEDKTRQKKGK